MGQQVNIGGFVGTVVEYVRNSIKVRSPEGSTRSYNIYALRRIYGRPSKRSCRLNPNRKRTQPVPPAAEKRNIIAEPNFDVPLRDIQDIIKDPDFPMCAFGQYLDLHGYSGVVVEIVGNSLKIRSREGATRSYKRKVFESSTESSLGRDSEEASAPQRTFSDVSSSGFGVS